MGMSNSCRLAGRILTHPNSVGPDRNEDGFLEKLKNLSLEKFFEDFF